MAPCVNVWLLSPANVGMPLSVYPGTFWYRADLLDAAGVASDPEKLKQQLRPLVGQGDAISIIAHSWGTVVAYESLIDLEVELPVFQLADLFTLGSPLWAVQQLLDDRSGRKPRNTGKWVNIHAQGDVIGSWLKPGFRVDQDYAVPDFSNGRDPHGSYFLPGNAAVQDNIVEVTIEGPGS